MNQLTQKYLKSLLEYNPETGAFIRIKRTSNSVSIGDLAGTLSYGYISISINNKKYQAHRLAWLYMTGAFPQSQIDHRDQNKSNNVWSNLRECTHLQNMTNRNEQKNNTSGYKGVSWCKRIKKWRVCLSFNGRYKHLGYFDDKHSAAAIYNKKALELHGDFACLNNI